MHIVEIISGAANAVGTITLFWRKLGFFDTTTDSTEFIFRIIHGAPSDDIRVSKIHQDTISKIYSIYDI